MENRFITDAVRARLEEAMRQGHKVEIKPKENKDGTKEVLLYQIESKKIELRKAP